MAALKKLKKVLVTGSAGLIGSQAVAFFASKGFEIFGIDNNMRAYFFGESAGTEWNVKKLTKNIANYHHLAIDIRDTEAVEKLFKKNTFDLIIHTAAQPSHDWATKEPITDFSINALGTLYLLEAYRKYCPEGVFIFTSTNKVYGDTPNTLPLIEKETRYELAKKHHWYDGIDETMSIDKSKHSLFGVSKTAADLLVQEYGKYFNLKTVSFRCGCLTGPAHSGAKLHGFLSYLVQSVSTGMPYTILGYKGKQVRDNIHSYDLVNAFYHFYLNPKRGEIYNFGGSRHSNISIIEAIKKVEKVTGKKALVKYIDSPRSGDHIWYISNIDKFKKNYPQWEYTYTIDAIIEELCLKGVR